MGEDVLDGLPIEGSPRETFPGQATFRPFGVFPRHNFSIPPRILLDEGPRVLVFGLLGLGVLWSPLSEVWMVTSTTALSLKKSTVADA